MSKWICAKVWKRTLKKDNDFEVTILEGKYIWCEIVVCNESDKKS